MLIKFRRKFCKMITIKRVLISVLVACLFQILITCIFISSINFSRNNNDFIKGSDINIDKDVQTLKIINSSDDFEPPCNMTNKDALSAFRRAKTTYCKQKIANISCLIKNGTFYPKSLQHSCPTNGMKYGKHVGCYADQYKERVLPDYKKAYDKSNSRKKCLDKCYLEGFPYAGVQYGVECFCGHDKPPSTSKLSEDACNMPCSGASKEICGGNLTMNVFETGVARFFHKNQTLQSNTTSGESVKIVFLLTINGRALRQLHRLINALYRSWHYFYIHIDSRQDYLHRKLSVLEEKFPNIKLVKKRFSTIWSASSYVTMTISSLRELSSLNWEWDFVINLSESDFPIKAVEGLESFLSVNKGNNFVKSHGRGNGIKLPNPGIYKTFLECEEHMWLIGDRTLPEGMITDGGSDWVVLSKEFVSYVVGPKDQFLTGLETIYNHTIFASESYFHTVLRNTPFCQTKINNNLHIVNWNRTQGCKCQYRHIVDWCGCSPMDFRLEHWKNIEKTKNEQVYFGRKFEPVVCHEIINKVENFIGFDDHDSIENLNAYWESLFDIEDNISSKDDLLISHAKSITRISANDVSNERCEFKSGGLIEINMYFKADVYEGNLVLHKASSEGRDIILETLYKPKNFFISNSSNEYSERIKTFKVSSQYDLKEQVFKNFANILGPFTEPVLFYEITPNIKNKTDNFTICWLDPANNIASMNEIHVDTKNYSNFINSKLLTPILPGMWKVGLFLNYTLIARTQFLITPLDHSSRKELSSEKAAEINGVSQYFYPQFNKNDHLTDYGFTKKDFKENVNTHTKKTNDDIRNWIDQLSIQYYDVIKSCVSQTSDIEEPMRCSVNVIDVCELTEWSSLSPDPKSSIGNLNSNTGKLERLQVLDNPFFLTTVFTKF